MKIDNQIKEWAKIVKESFDLENQIEESSTQSIFDHFTDFFKDEHEVEVNQDKNGVYIGFDASGYDNKSYADSEFERIFKEVEDEVAEVNKYEHTNIAAEPDPENEYTILLIGDDEQLNEGMGIAEVTFDDGTKETVKDIRSLDAFIQWYRSLMASEPEGDVPDIKSVSIDGKFYTRDEINDYELDNLGKLNEVSTGHRNDEDPTMSAKPNFKAYRDGVKKGNLYGIADLGDEMELFIQALKDTNNWEDVLNRMDVQEIATIFGTILDNVDEDEFQAAYGTLLEENCKTNESSSRLDYAKKLGYGGSEEEVADWLKGDYAKWKDATFQSLLKIANGNEEQAKKWFDVYDWLETGWIYKSGEEKKNQLYKEIGDTPEAQELKKKLDDHIRKETNAVSDYYSGSYSNGNFTGD